MLDLDDGRHLPTAFCSSPTASSPAKVGRSSSASTGSKAGRPIVSIRAKKYHHYNAFGVQLADRGFVVFAPQNPYIFGNQLPPARPQGEPARACRSIRSSSPSMAAFSIGWRRSHFVDPATRIAFYGLSYGGKVAMRIPAIETRYCLSICSGDFNEWIWKNINLDWTGSYMFTGEYDMYEFDLGNTFNYAEMAALIAPRPFMVERGHSDGVGLDEYVAFEYAKVRRLTPGSVSPTAPKSNSSTAAT